jgi:hypothetical protein
MAGGCGSDGFGMPTCGIDICGAPGICPAEGAPAGGAAGGGAARFAGAENIRVYSLGPCGVPAGVDPGVTRNTCVAPPPGP